MKYFLHNGWKFSGKQIAGTNKKMFEPGYWIEAIVPGTVHTDLLNAGLIDDPFYSDNENKLQWIGESDWLYKLEFNLPEQFRKDAPIYLVFEGIDTVAHIKLNSKEIGFTDNMFRTYKFDISEIIKPKLNILEIVFNSPKNYACDLESKKGKLPVALNSERVFLRKAQYSFGWDWGPSFITMGIWKPVFLLQNDENIIIKNISFSTVNIKEKEATVKIRIDLDNRTGKEYHLKVIIFNSSQRIEKDVNIHQRKSYDLNLKIPEPDLWWPNGYGEPNLYKLIVQIISDENKIIDSMEKRIGIRTIELKLADNGKSTFYFLVNGIHVFVRGANWIPADSFLPRVNYDKYKMLLVKAKEANMNMLRVWGGGIYEQDVFYELCDELGLMVWQDFMFACAAYPENKEFLKNVATEVKENITRLQYHPAIALWCGNNENEWGWFNDQKKSYTKMPGYIIYHDIIPKILEKLDHYRPYWPSTPYSDEEDPNSVNSGNRHQWDLWSKWVDYNEVENDKSLFVTEFGFQSPANYDTISRILPPKERNPQRRIFEYHNKQIEGPERVIKFLASHLPVNLQLMDYIYLAQLNHGLALKKCIEHWRKRFPETNGTIIWQLNDCWPVTSWALIDSDLKPKLSYYFVKEVFKPNIVVFDKRNNNLDVIILNNSVKEFSGLLILSRVNLVKNKITVLYESKANVLSNSKSTVFSYELTVDIETSKEVIVSSLFDNNGVLIHRNYYLGLEWKHVRCSVPEITISETDVRNNKITVSSTAPAYFVSLYHPRLIFSRNGFILLPGEKLTIDYEILNSGRFDKNKITFNCLNNYLND